MAFKMLRCDKCNQTGRCGVCHGCGWKFPECSCNQTTEMRSGKRIVVPRCPKCGSTRVGNIQT